MFKDFKPIGLFDTIYKLITKMIVRSIKPLLPNIINPLRSIFIHNLSIEDNIIVIEEVAHKFKKVKPSRNIMAIKIDLTKAFDCLEWSFIKETLDWFGFPKTLTSLIMSYLTSSSISVLWNGEITPSFLPSRGIW